MSSKGFDHERAHNLEVRKMYGKLKMKVDEIDVTKVKVKTTLALGGFCID